jgi:predicted metal-dependent HD superfamily phosphohydrolase
VAAWVIITALSVRVAVWLLDYIYDEQRACLAQEARSASAPGIQKSHPGALVADDVLRRFIALLGVLV